MQREIIITADGSPSIWVPGLKESYHSKFGAIQESRHVFIEAGLLPLPEHPQQINILEVGFGTGLNALLTLNACAKGNTAVYYESIEPYPLNEAEVELFEQMLDPGYLENFKRLHLAPWETETEIEPGFLLKKRETTLENLQADQKFHLVYFDAFSPEVQPELWTTDIFQRLYSWMLAGGIICTYCSKGSVRRNMQQAGFKVEKLPGPPGKREMLRGFVISDF